MCGIDLKVTRNACQQQIEQIACEDTLQNLFIFPFFVEAGWLQRINSRNYDSWEHKKEEI